MHGHMNVKKSAVLFEEDAESLNKFTLIYVNVIWTHFKRIAVMPTFKIEFPESQCRDLSNYLTIQKSLLIYEKLFWIECLEF